MTRKMILISILIGSIIGAIGVIRYRYSDYKTYLKSPIISKGILNDTNLLSLNNTPTPLKSGSLQNSDKHTESNNALHRLRLMRSITMVNENSDSTNESNSKYDITVHYNNQLNQAKVEVDVINYDQITNHFDVNLNKDNIFNPSAFNNLMLDVPFCFYVEDRSKPPIVAFPEYFDFDDWSNILDKLDDGEIIRLDLIDKVELIKPKSSFKIHQNISTLDGFIQIELKDDEIQINSESEGEINIEYEIENSNNFPNPEISMKGIMSREYTIILKIETPYIINDISYEAISDLSINNSFQQTVIESIYKE